MLRVLSPVAHWLEMRLQARSCDLLLPMKPQPWSKGWLVSRCLAEQGEEPREGWAQAACRDRYNNSEEI